MIKKEVSLSELDYTIHQTPEQFLAEQKKINEKLLAKQNKNWVSYICPHCGNTCNKEPNANLLCWHETKGKNPKKYSYPFYPNGFVVGSEPQEILRLVKNPHYFELLLTESSKRIVGELCQSMRPLKC